MKARVRNSTTTCGTLTGGLHGLTQHASRGDNAAPAVHLIEINSCAPDFQTDRAAAHAYGVDYYGLHLLLALRDYDRARILCTPFTTETQYWHARSFLPAMLGAIFVGKGVVEAMRKQRLDLHRHLVESVTLFRHGDRVADPRSVRHLWLATFSTRSKEIRRHVLEAEDAVQSYFRQYVRVDKPSDWYHVPWLRKPSCIMFCVPLKQNDNINATVYESSFDDLYPATL